MSKYPILEFITPVLNWPNPNDGDAAFHRTVLYKIPPIRVV